MRGGDLTRGYPVRTPGPDHRCLDATVVPAVDRFAPDLIVVSAGFDAHIADPLAELRLDDSTYAGAAARVRRLADTHCAGRSVWFLEGGYDLTALGRSVCACLHELIAA